ncbi:MAG: hypothetical protein IT374_24105 [Polyangiaceae bacterium]|nr:hypothetical protein [Polyangiaceae bacterium]
MRRWAFALVVACAGCERPRAEPPPGELQPSPNASILPAPLTSSEPRAREAPQALRSDEPMPPDTLGAKETSGVSLVMEWKPQELPSPPRAPETHAEGLATLRRATALRTTLQLTETGRLRLVFEGRGFPLPAGTELRARGDRLGHALVFPGATEYRPAAPGTLRSLFGDRRLDALPLVSGQIGPKKELPPRLGRAVSRYSITTKLGALTLDVARAPELGQGGVMLCRLLVELVGVDPSTLACEADQLPIRAHLAFPTGGIVLDLSDLPAKRVELPLADLSAPPPGATLAAATTPTGPAVVASREELALLRTRELDTTPAPGAPPDGLLVRSGVDSLRAVMLDGALVAWLDAGESVTLAGLRRGRYTASSRTLLGDAADAPRAVEAPGRFTLGEPPAPAPARSAK